MFSFLYLAIECPPLDPIINGFINYAPNNTPNYDLGTVATYNCDAGFVLDLSLGGSVTRTCVDDNGLDAIGEFNNQAPRCIRKWLKFLIQIKIFIIIVSVTLINVQVHVTTFHHYSTEWSPTIIPKDCKNLLLPTLVMMGSHFLEVI